jgi:hypothetical protein
MNDFDKLADELVEKKYQLRIEHNHSDMKWYAYYSGKNSHIELFDEQDHTLTMSDTPTEAIQKLRGATA